MKAIWKRSAFWTLLGGLGLLSAATGCQSTYNGQSLPSPYYLQQPVQYYPPGPWFKLQGEADQMKLYSDQAAQQNPNAAPPPPVPGGR